MAIVWRTRDAIVFPNPRFFFLMAEVVLSQSGTELRIQDGGVCSNTRNLEAYLASSWFLPRQTREKPLRATVRSFELTAVQRHGRIN